MTTSSLPPAGPFRRIITTRAEDGTSRVHLESVARSFGTLNEIWRVDGTQCPLTPFPADPVGGEVVIHPNAGGSVCRFVFVEPESRLAHLSADERRAQIHAGFARIGATHALVNTAQHPAMHQTETVDYIIVLAGELTMLLDVGEVQLRPFDVVVQRGTNHAWVNKSQQPALLAAVLIAAESAHNAKDKQ